MYNNHDPHIPYFLVNQETNRENFMKIFTENREQIDWSLALTRIYETWRDCQGEGARVAILDTGVNLDHPDLNPDAIEDYKDFSGDGIEDENGHGTHCAGIIGARKNNFGFIGVAPKSKLLIGKVLKNNGSGSYDAIVKGIEWAVEKEAHIINMSLGGPVSTNEMFVAVQKALEKGICVICAAGNDGSFGQNNIGYPGRYGGVLTIAAHDMNGNVTGFSSRGGEIDFMAPGHNIWSTYKNKEYAKLSGTSMATPFVSGLAALVISKHLSCDNVKTPVNNIEDLKEHLMRIAAHPGFHDNSCGYGPLVPFEFFEHIAV